MLSQSKCCNCVGCNQKLKLTYLTVSEEVLQRHSEKNPLRAVVNKCLWVSLMMPLPVASVFDLVWNVTVWQWQIAHSYFWASQSLQPEDRVYYQLVLSQTIVCALATCRPVWNPTPLLLSGATCLYYVYLSNNTVYSNCIYLHWWTAQGYRYDFIASCFYGSGDPHGPRTKLTSLVPHNRDYYVRIGLHSQMFCNTL